MKVWKLINIYFILALTILASSCTRTNVIESINENELFTLNYGSFEEQLSVTQLNKVGAVHFGICMRDGFFYLVNGESHKILELNSYGDLLTLFFNEDSQTAQLLERSTRAAESVRHQISYPFDYPGQISVDSKKCIYTVCSIPRDRQEQSDDGTMLLSETVLRFNRDGSYVDYIGQQGPGGTPFPQIKNLYTNQNDELIVVTNSMDGMNVFWYGSDGYLKYEIPITKKRAPRISGSAETSEVYMSIENVIPDPVSYKLYVKIDYYSSYVDEESKVQSGVNYISSLLYPMNIETGLYEEPVSIPPYEESIIADYSRLTYRIPYDFLGVTKNGWKFFIIKTDTGFNIEMLQNENQRILRRHFDVDHSNILFNSMNLSQDGIISALYLEKEKARVVWYRTDSLIESILKA